jgi:ribosome-associated protein
VTTDIPIHGEFITLGQLLKLAGVLGSGGEVRAFLQETSIRVNGEHDNRRGRKLHPGDIIVVEGFPETLRVVVADADAPA